MCRVGENEMMISRCLLAGMLACTLSTAALAKVRKPSLRDQEQAACYHDATTLCNDAVPDEKKIETCMRAKLDQVSPGCKKFFR